MTTDAGKVSYFHTACGHRHETASEAASCPTRGWSQVDRGPWPVIRVTVRPEQITRTELVKEE